MRSDVALRAGATDEQLAALDEAMPAGAAAGDRYPAESMGSVEL
jgi:hypothetical protein